MSEVIHWPDNCDLGKWADGGTNWKIRAGELLCEEGSLRFVEGMSWQDAVYHNKYSWKWSAWMQQRARDLGFMEPISGLLDEAKAALERVANAASIAEIKAVLQ